MADYLYEIDPRPAELGGWKLRLLEDGEEVGGGVFPADPNTDHRSGMDWWNGLEEIDRQHWMRRAGDSGRGGRLCKVSQRHRIR